MSLPDVVVRGEGTVSDRIRALNAAGYPRADIARILGKRYQHVRNVLEADADRIRPAPQPSATASPPSEPRTDATYGVLRMRLGADGSVVIPADLLARFGFKPGSLVIGEVEGETIVIPSRTENIRRVQESVRRHVPEGVSLVDELIADRRAENAKDERGE